MPITKSTNTSISTQKKHDPTAVRQSNCFGGYGVNLGVDHVQITLYRAFFLPFVQVITGFTRHVFLITFAPAKYRVFRDYARNPVLFCLYSSPIFAVFRVSISDIIGLYRTIFGVIFGVIRAFGVNLV